MRLMPASLYGRLALILVAGLLAAQAASLLIHGDERELLLAQFGFERELARIADAADRLDRAAPEHRDEAVRELRQRGIDVVLLGQTPPRGGWVPPPLRRSLAERLGSAREWQVARPAGPMRGMHGPLAVELALSGGGWARFALAPQPMHHAPLSGALLTSLALSLATVIGVSLLAVRWATRPLRQLAAAADALATDLDRPPLEETGPAEARAASVAFNGMQRRLARLIAERTRALSAMSHDLRTPLTRLRLRTEMMDDTGLRGRIQADLDEMQKMVEGTLDYLRGMKDGEPLRPLDVNALAHSLAEDFAAAGMAPVSVEGAAAGPLPARAGALRRALSNLLDNALKYAGAATLTIDDSPALLRLAVEDRGPGIAESALAAVQEPFQRLDAARTPDGGGVGLGLTIARDIAALHGGRLVLANRPGGGLSAALELPRRA